MSSADGSIVAVCCAVACRVSARLLSDLTRVSADIVPASVWRSSLMTAACAATDVPSKKIDQLSIFSRWFAGATIWRTVFSDAPVRATSAVVAIPINVDMFYLIVGDCELESAPSVLSMEV